MAETGVEDKVFGGKGVKEQRGQGVGRVVFGIQ